MKHFIAAMTCLFVACYSVFGQCTVDKYCIGNISVTYQVNKFVVSGFEVNDEVVLENSEGRPAISIFIETGDGNFISQNLYPERAEDIEIPYNYPQMDKQYFFKAEATKKYDGGGPRRVSLSIQTAEQTSPNPNPVPNHTLPDTLAIWCFPNDIVQDDSITIVISTVKTDPENLFFHYDNRLVDGQPFFGNNCKKIGDLGHSGVYRIQQFSVSEYVEGSGSRVAFIRIKPDQHFVGNWPMNTDAPPFYVTSNGQLQTTLKTLSLKVLASHDPNNINLSFCDYCPHQNGCSPPKRRQTRNQPITFHYTVNFENSGTNNEDSVEITYHCEIQHLKDSITRSDLVFAGQPYIQPAYRPLSQLHIRQVNEGLQGNELEGTDTFMFAKPPQLMGTNRLNYGDPLTQGRITFTIKSKKKFKELSSDDKIVAWAEIKFLSAGGIMKTEKITTTRKDFAKYYNRKCICQNTFVVFRWVCRLFKGI